jgi:hypothetical protein
MKRGAFPLLSVTACLLAALVWVSGCTASEDSTNFQEESAQSTTQSVTSQADAKPDEAAQAAAGPPRAGRCVYLDPRTGEITNTKPANFNAIPLDPKLQNAFSKSSQGLKTVKSPVPGGGEMIDLQGRFKSANVAVVNDAGKVEAKCLTPRHCKDDTHDHDTRR